MGERGRRVFEAAGGGDGTDGAGAVGAAASAREMNVRRPWLLAAGSFVCSGAGGEEMDGGARLAVADAAAEVSGGERGERVGGWGGEDAGGACCWRS